MSTPAFNPGGTITLNAPSISTISNGGTITLPSGTDTLVGRATTDTLTNKTLTAPTISTITNVGTITLPTATDTLVGTATTDTLTNKTLTAPVISTITNGGTITLPSGTDTLVGRATTDTLTNKTLTAPVISTIRNTGTITLPTATDTLVGRATTDTLTNKTIANTGNTITVGGTNITSLLGQAVLSSSNVAFNTITLGGATATIADITFPSAVKNRRISLYTTVDNDNQYFGFGINPSAMRCQVDGTSSDFIFYAGTSATTSVELMRIKGTGGGILLPTSGGTATALTYYEQSSFSSTFTCGSVSTGSVTINAVRIGILVYLYFGSISLPAGTAGTFTNNTLIPSKWRSNANTYWTVPVTNASVIVAGRLSINNAGNIVIAADITGANFGTSGNIGWPAQMVAVYTII